MILITGATGSLGSYLVETLLKQTSDSLCLLVREPNKLVFPYYRDSRIQIVRGDLTDLRPLQLILAQTRILIHAATAWGGADTFQVNLKAPLALFNALSPACEAVFYFSTASILKPHSQGLVFEPQSLNKGTEYIRSKAAFYHQLQTHPLLAKISLLYPTVMIGGDAQHHFTPLTVGLLNLPQWLRWGGRYLRVDGSFHWIHAQEIAALVAHWIKRPASRPQAAVLGNPALSIAQCLAESCHCFGLTYQPWLPVEPFLEPLLWGLAPWMNPWDRFSLQQRYLVYPVRNMVSEGLATEAMTWGQVLKFGKNDLKSLS